MTLLVLTISVSQCEAVWNPRARKWGLNARGFENWAHACQEHGLKLQQEFGTVCATNDAKHILPKFDSTEQCLSI